MGFFDKIKKALIGETKEESAKKEELLEVEESQEKSADTEIKDVEKETAQEESAPENMSPNAPENAAAEKEQPVEETQNQNASESTSERIFEDTSENTVKSAEDFTKEDQAEEVQKVQDLENQSESAVEEDTIKYAESGEQSDQNEVEAVDHTPEKSLDQKSIQEETVQEKYEKGLKKTRKTFGQRLNELFANFRSVDEDFFEEVEEALIGADVGFDAALKITEALRQEVKLKNVKKPAEVQNVIIEKLVDLYGEAGVDEVNELNMQSGLTVILFVGVNGVGKTTSIGKLAHQFKNEGKKVLMAAADTFRAGAIDQLVVWGERADVEVVRGKAGGDPAAVVYDAMERAKAEQADVLLVDTAGRLQNKVNLMNELEKIKRIIQRVDPSAPHEVLLVLDATTGQNAMVQAKQFKETTDVTGLVLTKLDGTAKGGIVLAIRNELHLPVKLVGLGEGIDDLEPFNPNEFVIGVFKGLINE